MTDARSIEGRISAWMEEREAGTHFPDRLLSATFEQTRTARRARSLRPRTTPAFRSWAGLAAAGTAVAIVLAGFVGMKLVIDQPVASPSPAPTGAPETSGGMWPQSSIEEVRAAQERSDAGDPAYTWQRSVDELQVGQNHPCSGASNGCWRPPQNSPNARIFIRFLEEKLHWESYLWAEGFAHPDGVVSGDVVFVRCAPGQTNLLWPSDPVGAGCAPTIDALRYETVKIHVAQPDRTGFGGIWVVTNWEITDPAAQADGRVIESESAVLVSAFLQARIDGAGADEHASFPEHDPSDEDFAYPEIPLLYATSTGAPYERSEFETLGGPVWPDGSMRYVVRLFAENPATVVEQQFSLDWDESDHPKLAYDFEEWTGDGPGSSENGEAVPFRYAFRGGLLSYRAAYPLFPSHTGFNDRDRLSVDGNLPDDDSSRSIVVFVVNPSPSASRCDNSLAPLDAEALARTIEADPNFDSAPPTSVTIGGRAALQIDGAVASAITCGVDVEAISTAAGNRGRLYLVDIPGPSPQVLAISITADLDSFETVLQWALPVVDSIEFDAP